MVEKQLMAIQIDYEGLGAVWFFLGGGGDNKLVKLPFGNQSVQFSSGHFPGSTGTPSQSTQGERETKINKYRKNRRTQSASMMEAQPR